MADARDRRGGDPAVGLLRRRLRAGRGATVLRQARRDAAGRAGAAGAALKRRQPEELGLNRFRRRFLEKLKYRLYSFPLWLDERKFCTQILLGKFKSEIFFALYFRQSVITKSGSTENKKASRPLSLWNSSLFSSPFDARYS